MENGTGCARIYRNHGKPEHTDVLLFSNEQHEQGEQSVISRKYNILKYSIANDPIFLFRLQD